MSANNSKTNRSIRRASALQRFKLDPAKANDEAYQKAKETELASLKKPIH